MLLDSRKGDAFLEGRFIRPIILQTTRLLPSLFIYSIL